MAGLVGRTLFFSLKTPLSSLTATPKHKHLITRSLSDSNPTPFAGRKLVLYSKKECCLCDALKDKLHTAFMIGGHHSLADFQLEVRDISTNPQWEKAYQYEIPVLARVLADGSEETLPRMSPRLSAEQVQQKLAALLA